MYKKSIVLLIFGGISCLPVLAYADETASEDFDCGKLDDSAPQMARNFCAEKKFDAADKTLNDAYKKAIAEAKKTDEDMKDMDPKLVGAVDALKKAQRGWISYRDGHCELAGFSMRGGNAEYEVNMNCKTDLSEKRAKELLSPKDY